MFAVRGAVLAVVLSISTMSLVPNAAGANEQWLIQIQRYLSEPEQCISHSDTDAFSRRHTNRHVQSTAAFGPTTQAAFADGDYEISCLQGTRVVRKHGFHHIEVVSCDDVDFYAYEALRGRVPWRMKVSRFSGKLVEAAPLY